MLTNDLRMSTPMTVEGWKGGSVVKGMAALPEDPDSIPITQMAAHTCL